MKVAQAHRAKDPDRIAQARRDLAQKNIEAAIARALEKAPPLTPAQIKLLSGLLRGNR